MRWQTLNFCKSAFSTPQWLHAKEARLAHHPCRGAHADFFAPTYFVHCTFLKYASKPQKLHQLQYPVFDRAKTPCRCLSSTPQH
jgi:hypothetical protein